MLLLVGYCWLYYLLSIILFLQPLLTRGPTLLTRMKEEGRIVWVVVGGGGRGDENETPISKSTIEKHHLASLVRG